MSIHDGTSPDETLPDTTAASTPTDAEKLLAEVIKILMLEVNFAQRTMGEQSANLDTWKYWTAIHKESKRIHDFFAGQTVESLLTMYEEDNK